MRSKTKLRVKKKNSKDFDMECSIIRHGNTEATGSLWTDDGMFLLSGD